MKFDWNISLGTILTALIYLIAFVATWTKMGARLSTMEEWRAEQDKEKIHERTAVMESWIKSHTTHAQIEEERLNRILESQASTKAFTDIYGRKIDLLLERFEGLKR